VQHFKGHLVARDVAFFVIVQVLELFSDFLVLEFPELLAKDANVVQDDIVVYVFHDIAKAVGGVHVPAPLIEIALGKGQRISLHLLPDGRKVYV
jgi:hypothetical protein